MRKLRCGLSGAMMLSAGLLVQAQPPRPAPAVQGPGAGRGGAFTHPEPIAFAFEGLLGVQLEGRPDAARVVFRRMYLKPL